MGRGEVEAVDKENVQVQAVKRSSSIGSAKSTSATQKSLIPVLMGSKNENASPTATTPLSTKTRKPLGQLQSAQSPHPTKVTEKGTPKQAKTVELERTSLKTDRGSLTQIVGKSRTSSGVPCTPQNSPSKVSERKSLIGKNKRAASKSISSDAQKAQDDSASLSYWKELAESRREALESALQENYELHQRVEKLEADKVELEALVKEAEKLASLIDNWKNDLDESGLGGDVEADEEKE
ncbi:Geminin [Orchesella cincta]|uniref:Geminin n=1 Tax=Orchesella cincta TaxID=48709 RepID=A0A1D2MMM5_ORCCI|nr:Geminin [Orchesella cincta]